VIVVGIDPHKQTHTAVAVDAASGRVLAELTVKAREPGFERLVEWARELDPERIFAVEDGRHVSGHLERHLIGRGERSVRVPPRMMGEARRSDRIAGKSDPVDATAVARAALRHPELPQATLAGIERDLGLLVAHREMLVRERTDKICKLRWLLHDLDPDLAPPLRTLDRLKTLDHLTETLRALEPALQVELCSDLVARCREITTRANELERRIRSLVGAHAPALLGIPGCAALTAAKIVAETARVERFPTEGHFARYAGTAPIPASSGATHRQRFNRRGNRQLNAAIHRIAVTQLRVHEPARMYMEKKRAEGKTKTEALRGLKRLITRSVFKTMTSMHLPTHRLTAAAA
ncbi:MAG: IS110 family transposase, partial [Chloroflexota bacterium]|nr:IS110 family transposase [Chloroflexota bacterium]